MILGHAVSKLETFVYMNILNHACLKIRNLASVHPKSIKLGQMTNLDKLFHVVLSVYRLVKI